MADVWSSIGPPPCTKLSEGDRHYALVDGAQMLRLGQRLSGTEQVLWHAPLFGTSLAPDAVDATPHLLALVDLMGFNALMRDWRGKLGSHGALTWLVSPLLPAELCARLRIRLDARLPDRFDCINRFFDGRVTPHLHQVLTPEQRQVFFSPCSQWWVLGADHRWASLQCRYEAHDAFVPPLVLDDKQQADLIDACYPYAVIEHFVQTDEELLDSITDSQRYAFFRHALQVAATFGIDGGAGAVLFCTLALTRGPLFYEEPAWRIGLERVRRGEISLQQVVKARHD